MNALPVVTFLIVLCLAANSPGISADDRLGVLIPESSYLINYCEELERYCGTGPDAKLYSGMKGRLTSLRPVKREFGRNFFEIEMANGDMLYYNTEHDDAFSPGGPLSLSEHKQKKEMIGRPIIEGSPIHLESVELEGSYYTYTLDNGDEIGHFQFPALRALLREVRSNKHKDLVGLIAQLEIEHDRMENRFFIKMPQEIGVSDHHYPPIQPYVGFKDGETWMRYKLYYRAGRWLFAERVVIVSGSDRRELNSLSFERDNSSRSIWEWADRAATHDDIITLESVASSADSTVRFYGKQKYADREVSLSQSELINDLLSIYQLLK